MPKKKVANPVFIGTQSHILANPSGPNPNPCIS
jgi:hypothetical protein